MDSETILTIEALLPQLGWATAMIMACVTVHGLGLALVTHFVRVKDGEMRETHLPPVSVRGIATTLAIVYALFVLHGAEIWMFGLFYHAVGALPSLDASIYYWIISYGAIGYDDAHIAHDWRVVGALEGICGIILLGWSTAYFVRMLGRIDFKPH